MKHRLIIRLFTWAWSHRIGPDERVIEVKGWRSALIDNRAGAMATYKAVDQATSMADRQLSILKEVAKKKASEQTSVRKIHLTGEKAQQSKRRS